MERPVSERRDRLILLLHLMAVLIPLLVYLRTLARSVTFIDGGELSAVAAVLGIAHPPGYPLFTLMGHLFSLLPWGSVFFRVSLLSAVAGAVASGLVFRIAWSAFGAKDAATTRNGAAPGRRDLPGSWVAFGALGGAWLFAFADTPWSQAVIVEVYALHGCLVAACLAACLWIGGAWGRGDRGSTASTARSVALRWQAAWLPGFLLALALTNHLTAVLLVPAVVIALAFAWADAPRPRRISARMILSVVGAAALPFTLYLYLPIRSRMHPAVNWDYPETWHRFYIHVSAAQYRPILGSEGLKGSELRRFLVGQLPAEATWVLPGLALLGLVVLGRERRRALWLTLPTLVAFLLYNLAYPIHDLRVYYLPVLLLLSIYAAAGAAWIVRRAAQLQPRGLGRIAAPVAAVLLLAAALPALIRNFPRNDMRDRRVAELFARDAVRTADPGGVIFSADADLFSEPMIYLQHVEHLRPDLVVLDIDRLESPMLARNLAEWCPELGEACRREVAIIGDFAAEAEHGRPFDGRRRDEAYAEMLRALVRESVRLRPTYALGGAFRNAMFAGYERHPEGLLVRLTSEANYRPFATPRFDLPARLRNRHLAYEEKMLLGEYGRMLDGRLWYLGQHHEEAGADSIRTLLRELPR